MPVNYKCPKCGNIVTTQYEVPTIQCPYCQNVFNAANGQQPPQFNGGQQQQQYAYGQQPNQQQYAYGQQPNQQQPYGYPPQSNDIFATGPSGKSRGIAGLLAIFLGSLGIHYFYVGKTTPGIVFLLVSLIGGVITCGVLAGVVGVIALVQGIMMLCMSQQEFENKYVNTTQQFPLF